MVKIGKCLFLTGNELHTELGIVKDCMNVLSNLYLREND